MEMPLLNETPPIEIVLVTLENNLTMIQQAASLILFVARIALYHLVVCLKQLEDEDLSLPVVWYPFCQFMEKSRSACQHIDRIIMH